MARSTVVVCALAGIGLFLVGCTQLPVPWVGYLGGWGSDNDIVVAGSLESVQASLQGRLNQMGLAAYASRDGEAVRIRSTSTYGPRFSLVLTREKKDQKEQTRVRIDWEDGRDEDTHLQLLALFEGQKVR